ncbi:MAG: YHS domain-containing (seleno)protein [Bryobacteraceae bacterium]
MTRRTTLLTLLAATAARTKDQVDPTNKSRNGLAIKGYDPVAYFTQSRPVKGLPAYSATHNGATYLFSTAENRDAFNASPAKYAPQFGGYCAWAVGHGYTADIDPEAWHIDNNRLFLNYNKKVQTMWLKDKAKWIADADRNWPTLHK